jgi:hypothetical protein
VYATCLFCNTPLGQNEVLEHFPVGRRLAYDKAKGRLWVVCTRCERWNLTPLETRWEAIDEAERAYRATTLRVSTDNISMAQLDEGLELVRIGAPPKIEFAAWRYGDQFGRRRRRHLVIGAGALAAALVPFAINVAGIAGLDVALGAAAGFTSAGASLTLAVVGWRERRTNATVPRIVVRDDRRGVLRMTYENIRTASFVPDGSRDGWVLKVPNRIVRSVRRGDGKQSMEELTTHSSLTGLTAQRALSQMLPHLNRDGGSDRRVRDATHLIAESPTLAHLLRTAATNTEMFKTHYKVHRGTANVGALPGRIRLALEMALHEDDERRAMEGELVELEHRWRVAEEVANIADSLLLPEEIEKRVEELRNRGDEPPANGD